MGLKIPRTFAQQMLRLKEHKIIIDDEDACICFLQTVNYYRFSAYLLPFRNADKSYKDSASFENAKMIYDFDAKMRGLLFQVIEEIELRLRTQLSYWHSHKYGALGYEDECNFGKRHRHEKFMQLIQKEVGKNIKTAVVQHHIKNYGGKLPLWVVIEYFSTGMISHFYADLKSVEKKAIARRLYATNVKSLDSWLRCITDLRNRCAHYSRLYNWKFTALPVIPECLDYVVNRKLFDQLLVLKFLHPTNARWTNVFLVELQALIEEYSSYIDLSEIGFPDGWEDILKKT